ncbi:MAG: SDR family oxidoreductase [Alphaproteobacteria bacterium]
MPTNTMMSKQDADKSAKIAIVTGAAHRIGRAIAFSLAQQNWRVAIHYHRSQDEAEMLAGDIDPTGKRATAVPANLSDIDSVRQLVPRVTEHFDEAPHCLINNASLYMPDSIGKLDPAQWQAHLDVNLRAPVLLGESLAGHLPASENGNIINIIDHRVMRPTPDYFSYSLSKAGIWWATLTMAQALAPRIRVNAIGPGPVLKSIHETQAAFDAKWSSTPLGQGATPDDITRAVHFLLMTPSITGQMICLDGGQTLG